jgi:SAM-dependent methyltransferase
MVAGSVPGVGEARVELVERAGCPVCGGRSASVRMDLPYDAPPIEQYLLSFYGGRLDPARLAGERYRLMRCPDCSLVYQRDVPAADFLAELYGELIDEPEAELQRRRGLAVRRAYASQVERAVSLFGLPSVELDVLDFGAGSGMWLRFAQAYGCRTAAVELTVGAGGTVPGADRTYAVDALPEAAFHYVNAEQVFEHLVDPALEMDRIARSLRPGGIVRVGVPSTTGLDPALAASDWSAPKGTARSLNAVAPLEHLNCYAGRSLQRLGVDGGLEPFRPPWRSYLVADFRPAELVAAVRDRVRRVSGVAYFRKR